MGAFTCSFPPGPIQAPLLPCWHPTDPARSKSWIHCLPPECPWTSHFSYSVPQFPHLVEWGGLLTLQAWLGGINKMKKAHSRHLINGSSRYCHCGIWNFPSPPPSSPTYGLHPDPSCQWLTFLVSVYQSLQPDGWGPGDRNCVLSCPTILPCLE